VAQNERDTSSSFLIWCCVYFLTISFADMWFFFLSSVPYLSSPFSLLFVYFYFYFYFFTVFFWLTRVGGYNASDFPPLVDQSRVPEGAGLPGTLQPLHLIRLCAD
jgi:hypothetical protein